MSEWIGGGLRAANLTLLGASLASNVIWRWTWRKYRAAFRAETEREVEAAKAAYEALMEGRQLR